MDYIAVEHLKQGMILGRDVHDVNTRLLFSKGHKLSQKHIRILKIWGISGVNIAGTREQETAHNHIQTDETADEVNAAIGRVFANAHLMHTKIKELVKLSLIHRLKVTSAGLQEQPAPTDDTIKNVKYLHTIKNLIDKLDTQLPEAPTIIGQLNQVIEDPLATSNDVARVVNTSPSLAATLLKIVNSAYYGFPSKIDRISRAVTIIGTKEISCLAIGMSVLNAFKNIPTHVVDMPAFIRHSLACGLMARILAARNNVAQTEQFFVSGLLHDIGKLIVFKYYPDHATACVNMANANNTSVFQVENEILGTHHPQIAKTLLVKWKLPETLIHNIVYHHHPRRSAQPESAGIVHLADIIANGLGLGKSGERSLPMVDETVVDHIVESAHGLKIVIDQAVHQLGPMEAILSN